MANDQSQEQRRGHQKAQEETTVQIATLMDICHLKKIRSWNHNSKNTKDVLRSEVTLLKTILARM